MVTFNAALLLESIYDVIHENRIHFNLFRILQEKTANLLFPILRIWIINKLVENSRRFQSLYCFVEYSLKQRQLLFLKALILKLFNVIILSDNGVEHIKITLKIKVYRGIPWKVKVVFNDLKYNGILLQRGLNNKRSFKKVLKVFVSPKGRNESKFCHFSQSQKGSLSFFLVFHFEFLD